MKMPLSVINDTTLVDNSGNVVCEFTSKEDAIATAEALNLLYAKRDILQAIPLSLNHIKKNSEISTDTKNYTRTIRYPDYLALKAYSGIIEELSQVQLNN